MFNMRYKLNLHYTSEKEVRYYLRHLPYGYIFTHNRDKQNVVVDNLPQLSIEVLKTLGNFKPFIVKHGKVFHITPKQLEDRNKSFEEGTPDPLINPNLNCFPPPSFMNIPFNPPAIEPQIESHDFYKTQRTLFMTTTTSGSSCVVTEENIMNTQNKRAMDQSEDMDEVVPRVKFVKLNNCVGSNQPPQSDRISNNANSNTWRNDRDRYSGTRPVPPSIYSSIPQMSNLIAPTTSTVPQLSTLPSGSGTQLSSSICSVQPPGPFPSISSNSNFMDTVAPMAPLSMSMARPIPPSSKSMVQRAMSTIDDDMIRAYLKINKEYTEAEVEFINAMRNQYDGITLDSVDQAIKTWRTHVGSYFYLPFNPRIVYDYPGNVNKWKIYTKEEVRLLPVRDADELTKEIVQKSHDIRAARHYEIKVDRFYPPNYQFAAYGWCYLVNPQEIPTETPENLNVRKQNDPRFAIESVEQHMVQYAIPDHVVTYTPNVLHRYYTYLPTTAYSDNLIEVSPKTDRMKSIEKLLVTQTMFNYKIQSLKLQKPTNKDDNLIVKYIFNDKKSSDNWKHIPSEMAANNNLVRALTIGEMKPNNNYLLVKSFIPDSKLLVSHLSASMRSKTTRFVNVTNALPYGGPDDDQLKYEFSETHANGNLSEIVSNQYTFKNMQRSQFKNNYQQSPSVFFKNSIVRASTVPLTTFYHQEYVAEFNVVMLVCDEFYKRVELSKRTDSSFFDAGGLIVDVMGLLNDIFNTDNVKKAVENSLFKDLTKKFFIPFLNLLSYDVHRQLAIASIYESTHLSTTHKEFLETHGLTGKDYVIKLTVFGDLLAQGYLQYLSYQISPTLSGNNFGAIVIPRETLKTSLPQINDFCIGLYENVETFRNEFGHFLGTFGSNFLALDHHNCYLWIFAGRYVYVGNFYAGAITGISIQDTTLNRVASHINYSPKRPLPLRFINSRPVINVYLYEVAGGIRANADLHAFIYSFSNLSFINQTALGESWSKLEIDEYNKRQINLQVVDEVFGTEFMPVTITPSF